MWVGLSGAPGGLRHMTMPLPGKNARSLDVTIALPLYLMTSSNHEWEVLSPSSR